MRLGMTAGFLYGSGAETLILVTGALAKKIVLKQKAQISSVYPEEKQRVRYTIVKAFWSLKNSPD